MFGTYLTYPDNEGPDMPLIIFVVYGIGAILIMLFT